MVGILVHGDNHFILSGPSPDDAAALAMARHWSIIRISGQISGQVSGQISGQIGAEKSSSFGQWEIRTKEFRENLEWAVVVPGDREISPGVAQLLGELAARGVTIRELGKGCR
jgi:hypothetical protein